MWKKLLLGTEFTGEKLDIISQRDATQRVSYLSAERFATEFAAFLQRDHAATFRPRYRQVDVLLVDGMEQVGRGKPSR